MSNSKRVFRAMKILTLGGLLAVGLVTLTLAAAQDAKTPETVINFIGHETNDEMTRVITPANARAPPDCSSKLTNPPIIMIARMTCTWVPAAISLRTCSSTELSNAASGL